MTIQTKRKDGLEGYDGNDPLMEGEELSHSVNHELIIKYLMLVLEWLFTGQSVGVVTDMGLKHVAVEADSEIYRSPDIAVIAGLVADENNPSATYEINALNQAPHVVFELGSETTWLTDVTKKPLIYAKMGISEYFTFDPNLVWTGNGQSVGSY
jgi:Uma2 family endonuclease